MGITPDTFAEWFEPGPGFLVHGPDGRLANQKPGARTVLYPVVPSIYESPVVDEWSKDLSTVEWRTVGSNWILIARTILVNDPWFRFTKRREYIDDRGMFTKEFRSKPWHPVYVKNLAVRVEEELDFYRALVINARGGQSESSIEDIHLEYFRFGFSKLIPLAKDLIPKIAPIFKYGRAIALYQPNIAVSIGIEIGFRLGDWAYREYKANQRAQARAERLKQKGFVDTELVDELGEQSDVRQLGYAPRDTRLYSGLFAGRGSRDPNLPDWIPIKGVPYITSQDGVYS